MAAVELAQDGVLADRLVTVADQFAKVVAAIGFLKELCLFLLQFADHADAPLHPCVKPGRTEVVRITHLLRLHDIDWLTSVRLALLAGLWHLWMTPVPGKDKQVFRVQRVRLTSVLIHGARRRLVSLLEVLPAHLFLRLLS